MVIPMTLLVHVEMYHGANHRFQVRIGALIVAGWVCQVVGPAVSISGC